MSLVEQTPAQDEQLSHQAQSELLAKTLTVAPDEDSDSLSAARGVVLGVALGGVLWALILWALL